MLLFGCAALPSLAFGLEVGLFIPHKDPFWEKVTFFTKDAASDLGVDLQVFNAGGDPERMVDQVKTAAQSEIDAIIFPAFQNTGEQILLIAEGYGIPAVLINSQLEKKDLLPRTKYAYWISSVLPDNQVAGTLLIQQLINEARLKGIEHLHVLAIEGNPKDASSVARVRGLTSFMKHLRQIVSFQLVAGRWNRETASELFKAYYNTNPDVNVVWCANDNMALGVVNAVDELGIDRPVIIGGMDWDSDAQAAIQAGRMQVSVGGHFLDGAWATVLLYDYLHDVDFTHEALQFESPMVAVTGTNADNFAPFLTMDSQSLDFSLFSKSKNPSLKRYQFDLHSIATRFAPGKNLLKLTGKEEAWLAEHKNIRLGVDPVWPPFEFIDSTKRYAGISSDYVRFLNKRLNNNMAPVRGLRWPEVMAKARSGDIDVLPCVAKTPERSKFLHFTKPYLVFPMVIVTREDAPFVNSIQDFKSGKAAVIKGYVSQEFMEQDYPDQTFYLADNIEAALHAVSNGKVDAFVGNLASISYTTQRLGLTNLKVATTTPYNFELSFAVRKDWPELVNILDIGLDMMPDEERTKIHNRWINVRFEHRVDWILIFKLIGGVVFVGMVIFFIIIRSNRKLAKEIRDRMRAEIALRDNEAASRGLLDATRESLFLLDTQGDIIAANQTGAHRLQKTPEELIGKNIFDLSPPALQSSRKANFNRVMQTGKPAYFEDSRDGTVFQSHYYPVQDNTGAVVDVAIFAQDITDRKTVEKALKESEERLKNILETSNEGFWLIDNDTRTTDVNDAMCLIMDRRREAIMGKKVVEFLDAENREILKKEMQLRGQGKSSAYELALLRPDGKNVPCLFNATPLFDASGDKIGSFAMVTDIAERKQAEEELRQNLDDLERFSKVAIGREERMIELKQEINTILQSTGQTEKYKIVD